MKLWSLVDLIPEMHSQPSCQRRLINSFFYLTCWVNINDVMPAVFFFFFYNALIHPIKLALAHGSWFKFVLVNMHDSFLLPSKARHLFWCGWCCWVADNTVTLKWWGDDNIFFICWQYYYSIKDISIGGRCVCHGHAQVCGGGRNPDNPNR